jgi:hypothetical protein
VAVHTKVAAGPISEAALFVLCAIRVDHDVARWGTIFPQGVLHPPSDLDGPGRANPKRGEPLA